MRKKTIAIALFLIAGILVYFNYFREENLPDDANQRIETTNAVYENEDYHVTAAKQTDFLKSKDTFFADGELKLLKKGTILRADSMEMDKENNVSLRKNIEGESESGWRLNSEQLYYHKAKDEISSDEGVKARDMNRDLSISSRRYRSDAKVTFMEMREDVEISTGKVKITGDSGDYSDKTKELVLSGKIEVSGYDKDNNSIGGEFKRLYYHIGTKQIRSEDPFHLLYRGIRLNGGRLVMNEADESFEITKDVSFEGGGYTIRAERIRRGPMGDIVYIDGPVSGGNAEYGMKAQRGEYRISEKKLYLLGEDGKLELTSAKGEKLQGNEIIFDNDKNTVEIKAKDKVRYQSAEGELYTKNIVYDLTARVAMIGNPYTFAGPRWESEGKAALYRADEKAGELSGAWILDKEKHQRVEGDKITADRLKETYILDGAAYVENDSYILRAPYVEYHERGTDSLIRGDYSVYMKKKEMTYKGTDALYNAEKGEFTDEGDVRVSGKNFEAYGRDLTYSEESGYGDVGSRILIENAQGTKIIAEKCTFLKDKEIRITGAVTLENEKIYAETTNGVYDLTTELVTLPDEIRAKSRDGSFAGTLQGGIYDNNSALFKGKNLVADYEAYHITADEAWYDFPEEKMTLSGNAVIRSRAVPGNVLQGTRLIYYKKTEEIEAEAGYTASYEIYKAKGERLRYGKQSGELAGKPIAISGQNGDFLEADAVAGRLSELRMDFTGNVTARRTTDGETTDFAGGTARVFLKKEGKNYVPARVEAEERVSLKQKEREAYAEYLEYQFEKKRLYAKDQVRVLGADEKNGLSEAEGHILNADILQETALLTGDVKLKNTAKNGDVSTGSGDRATLHYGRKEAELIGNARLESPEGIVAADRVFYEFSGRKAKARGNVYMEYKKKKN